MPLNLVALLKPVDGHNPLGRDLRSIAGLDSLYFKLKDMRAQARATERANEAAGEPANVPQEWQAVRNLAIDALAQSKDVEIAAWLLEALARLDGFVGLANGFALLQGLVERYWPSIHSIDEDDAAGRLSPLTGLNGTSSDGALVQPIRMIALLPGCAFGTNALWHFHRLGKEPNGALARQFGDHRATAGMAAICERGREASAARDAFVNLSVTLDKLAGTDAPPSSNIRNALDEVVEAYRSLTGGAIDGGENAHAEAEAPEAKNAVPANGHAEAGTAIAIAPREITNREEAFTELLRVADFFRRNEPHSPTSYALETLVSRGRMSFVDLLEELVPDAGARKQMLQHAGIHANTEKAR